MQARYQAAPRPDVPFECISRPFRRQTDRPIRRGPKSRGSCGPGLDAPNEVSKTDSRLVVGRECLHLGVGQPPSAQCASERAPGAPLVEEDPQQAKREGRDQSDNEKNDAEDRNHPLQSSSRSPCRSMKLPMLIPLLPISSRKLIMYPFAMSIASSLGIPASTSFV